MPKDKSSAASDQRPKRMPPCVLHHVSSTSRAVVAAWDRALKPAGLTGLQFGVLAVLATAGEQNVNNLARLLGMDPSTVPRVVHPLARRRLVSTRPGVDARERLIRVTARGRAKYLRARHCWETVQKHVVDGFGQEKWESLIGLLAELRAVLPAPGE